MEFFKDLFVLLGRVCIGGMFLWIAYDTIKSWHATMAHMRAKNIPKLNIVLPVAVALKIIGGLSVFFGWHSHIGALLLLIVTIPTLVKLHPFWKTQGSEKMTDKMIFLKGVGVVGGLLLVLALGAGHFAVSH